MALANAFKTNMREDYVWPYPKKISPRAGPPPMTTPKDPNTYTERETTGVCHCDMNLYLSKTNQYEQLASKEMRLCKELLSLGKKMDELSKELVPPELDGDTQEMITFYDSDYNRRGPKFVKYGPIRKEIDAPLSEFVRTKIVPSGPGRYDPCKFRYAAFVKPRIGENGPVAFITTPNSIEEYLLTTPARSDYQDAFSKPGYLICQDLQRFKYPLPCSPRIMHYDPCRVISYE